jgi:parallel beta-helix repeat protein
MSPRYLAILPLFLVSSSVLAADPKADDPAALEVSQDTVLDPNRTYGRIVITKSNVTLDGRGAWLIGNTETKPKEFRGVAVSAKGVSGVTLKNVNAKGWETGLKIEDGSSWTIDGCNFSDNFHDPAFGWGENGRRGGIMLDRVTKSVLRKCKANRVWDACVLVGCREVTVEENDFSRTSNTCLKLWNSSQNVIRKNNLSYGIRIDPGEVHARDSTCVLIESGSNDNRFFGNDCTHGGDGIFVRVLNGWVSTGNVFEENDVSYANNNGFEAWSPRNTYRRNKANHCSYGFWLGASDQTTLIDNEASFNGLASGHHNSPHLPEAGHAGIVFMFGPSSHTICRGNVCEGNNGAGIAAIGDLDSKGAKWKAFHWIIEQNTLKKNRWGVYLQHADWLHVGSNTFVENSKADVHDASNVTNLVRLPDTDKSSRPPRAILVGPTRVRVGQPVRFDASTSDDSVKRTLQFRWDVGDGTVSTESRVEHVFAKPGFFRLGLTVHNGRLSDLAWRDLYVTEDLAEIGTEGNATAWSWVDPQSRVTFTNDAVHDAVALTRDGSGGWRSSDRLPNPYVLRGTKSLLATIQPYSGGRVSLLYPSSKQAGWKLDGRRELVFWVKTINEHVPAWQDLNPLVTLHESDSKILRLTPRRDLLSQPPYNEAREGWTYFAVPLAGDATWERSGSDIETANYLTIGFDSWGAPPLRIWIDGLAWK